MPTTGCEKRTFTNISKNQVVFAILSFTFARTNIFENVRYSFKKCPFSADFSQANTNEHLRTFVPRCSRTYTPPVLIGQGWTSHLRGFTVRLFARPRQMSPLAPQEKIERA